MLFIFSSSHTFGLVFFFFKQKTAYEMRISDWSSDVCSSDLLADEPLGGEVRLGFVEVRQLVGSTEQRLDPALLDIAEQPAEGATCALRGAVELQKIGRASCRERVCQYG